MKAFKNRLEEMAEATVNALDYSDSKVEMVHYDKLGDFLLKASDVMDTDIPGNNQ